MKRDSDTFDYWAKLAKEDPAAFERERAAAIEAEINKAPEHVRRRLQGLQWRIDAERRSAKNPLVSCMKIYNMMWDKVYGEEGLLEALDTLLTGEPIKAPAEKSTTQADVVALRSKKS